MKTLFKILGVLAGSYMLLDLGWLIGCVNCVDYHNGRLNSNNKFEKDLIEMIDVIENFRLGENKKSSRKRSEILSAHARKWAKEGYSSEEIKQGLENLKKELD